MKRILSLTLALVMVLGTFTGVFAAEAEVNPAEFLKEVGVLEGDDDGNLMLDKTLLRRDMVILLSRLMGAEEIAAEFPGAEEILTFEDITDPYYNGYLAWSVSNKLIEGHDEKTFGFNENITAQDYATVLLRALSYDMSDDANWKKALETVKELGILEGVEVENKTEITREQMAVMTYNALGVKVKDSDKTLAEELGIELPVPAVLEVEEVKADNLKEIQVVFNKAVDRDNVEDRDIYTTNAGSIKDVELVEENVVVLTLEGEMKNKKEYKLDIRGIKDGDSAVNTGFKFTAIDNTIPEVVEVIGLGTKAIKVVMSEPVKNVKSSSFAIDGKSYYGSVSVTGREIVLKPYGSDFTVGEHTLVVKSLDDYAGFKSVEREISFEIVEDKDAPEVVEIKGTMERLVVTFNEDVEDSSVSTSSLYWGGVKSNKADRVVRLSGNRYAFEFSGSKTLPTYETSVTVTGVKDYSGNEMKTVDIAFRAEIDQTRPEVMDVEVDSKEIEVKFNKRVNKDDATDKKNYTLTDEDDKKVSLKSLTLSDDERVVTIELYSELKENKDYTLEITGIRDKTKLANTILPYKEVITAGNYKRPEVTAITANLAKGTIHILFNKQMDVETIADPSNYILAGESDARYALDAVKGEVDVIQDGKAVILELPEKIGNAKVEDMTFEGVILSGSIKDTSGNRVQKYGTVIPFDEGLITATAEATDKRTIEVEFSHPVTAARASDFEATNFSIDEVKVNGTKKVVIKTVEDLTAGIVGVKLEVKANNSIETVLDIEVESGEITVIDKIKPTLKSAEAQVNKSETKLTITLKFDEDLDKTYEALAKTDLVVTRSSDGKKIDMSKADVKTVITDDKIELTTTQLVKIDTAYEVEINNPSAIRDKNNGNVANKTDGAIVAEVKAVEDSAEQIAEAAVVKAEGSKKQEDVDAAQALVDALPEGEAKEALDARLTAVQNEIDAAQALVDAEAAVVKAEESKKQEDVDAAQALVDALPEGNDKAILQYRLDQIEVE